MRMAASPPSRPGFSHTTEAGTRSCSTSAATMASRARSWAWGPAAWNAITNGWPLVCMTALAISKERRLIASTISTHTAARARAPASRQAGSADWAAATAASRSRWG